MERVMVERVFTTPVDLAAVQESAARSDACFSSRRVVFVRTLVARDGLRMICEYEAPDAESVRVANQLAGMAFERVWTADVVEGPKGAR